MDLHTLASAPPTADKDLSPVAAHDAAHREQARAGGEPTDRTRGMGFPEAETQQTAFCWIDHASGRVVHRIDTFDTDVPARVNVDVLADLLDGDFVLVVPDHETVARLIRATASARAAGRCDPDKGAALHRRLEVVSRLSASSRLVVLTRALARRYWLPSNLADDDPLAWGRSFGFAAGKGVTYRLMQQLHRLAADGASDRHADEAAHAERDALSAARYPGLKMANAAYRAVERTESAVSAWTRLDERLLDRNVLTGDVCALRLTSVGRAGFTAVASQPFTLRVGKQHLLLTRGGLRARSAGFTRSGEGRLSHVPLSRVRVEDDEVLVEVETADVRDDDKPAARGNATALNRARAALVSGEPMFLTEQPFSGGVPNKEKLTGRWSATSRPAEIAGRWEMPLDVMFAGAPRAQP